jgi:hypothetical protein
MTVPMLGEQAWRRTALEYRRPFIVAGSEHFRAYETALREADWDREFRNHPRWNFPAMSASLSLRSHPSQAGRR